MNDVSIVEKRQQDRQSSQLSRYSWNVTSLCDEYRCKTRLGYGGTDNSNSSGDRALTDFLNEIHWNQLGSSAIPKRLPSGFTVHIKRGHNFAPSSILYCVVSAEQDGVHQRTKASSSKQWNTVFSFQIPTETNFRSCNVVVDVYDQTDSGKTLSLGQILIPFTMITDRQNPSFEGEFPCCKTRPPYRGSVVGSIDMRLELQWQ